MFAKALVVSILVAAPIQAQEAVTYPFEVVPTPSVAYV